jgi:hypothetical protein
MRRFLAAAALLSIPGCPSLPLMQSAETIPEGEVQHGIGVEYFGTNRDVTPSEEVLPLQLIPTYTVRFGVADHVDVGLRTSVFLNLAFDVKIQMVDTPAFDFAIAPSLQYAWFWGWLQLPVIVGLNLADSVQLVLAGRIAYFALLTGELARSALEEDLAAADFYFGAGAGLYVKAGPRFGVMPEIQYMRGNRAEDPAMWSFNVTFAIGAQPGPRPAAPPPPAIPITAPPAAMPPSSPPPPAGYAPPAPASEGAPPPASTPQIPPGYGTPGPTWAPTPAPTPPPSTP